MLEKAIAGEFHEFTILAQKLERSGIVRKVAESRRKGPGMSAEHPRAAEFTLEQCLALAAQGAGHSAYWLNKARDLASAMRPEVDAMKADASALEKLILLRIPASRGRAA